MLFWALKTKEWYLLFWWLEPHVCLRKYFTFHISIFRWILAHDWVSEAPSCGSAPVCWRLQLRILHGSCPHVANVCSCQFIPLTNSWFMLIYVDIIKSQRFQSLRLFTITAATTGHGRPPRHAEHLRRVRRGATDQHRPDAGEGDASLRARGGEEAARWSCRVSSKWVMMKPPIDWWF